ncbi:retrovirus-related Pol polyprotein from type-1 retrotransposable element R2 [Trichonephila inaurata madagascariensis]|uniref:Retrovirus-related Pol polyprotein from type-1 retrotransposable element R2 n=1 Tax=Trichonephila inaurata madagascariensis TaxID=2747483 RepID=A0A8X6XDM5_9ARAC|nr:retrovirus-related Pol polyprotein from type-1 retrotransposable element R2 [Trichonephila inaurata madagascariensis]
MISSDARLWKRAVNEEFSSMQPYTIISHRLQMEGPTPPIQLLNGVKQGRLLSGILFNCSIDKVLQTIQENREQRSILAFADDIVLLADDAEDLQEMISTTAHDLGALCLSLNPQKCSTLHFSGRVPTGSVPTKFQLEGTEIQALSDGDSHTCLGTPVGFFGTKEFQDRKSSPDYFGEEIHLAPRAGSFSQLCPRFAQASWARPTGVRWTLLLGRKSKVYSPSQPAFRTTTSMATGSSEAVEFHRRRKTPTSIWSTRRSNC